MIKQGVILASGLGSRLNSEGKNEPKPLMPVGGIALIERVVFLMKSAGIEHIVIVLGYRSEQIIRYIKERKLTGIVTVINDEYKKKNGISLLKARDALHADEPFVLSMADHIFSNDFFVEFIKKSEPMMNDGSVVLSVDKDIEGVFDLDDATKVFTEGSNIVKISKDLGAYNAIDTGLFLCSHSVFSKLEEIYKSTGDVSISDGMKAIADGKNFFAADMTGFLWQDVDTPSMKKEAEERLVDNYLNSVKNKDFFSISFFNKIAKELSMHIFFKEKFEYKIIEPAFFILTVFISILSARLQIVWPSMFVLFGVTVLLHFNQIRTAVSPGKEESKPFFLFSYEILAAISIFPIVFDTHLFFALIISILMLFVIFSPHIGYSYLMVAMLPEISENHAGTYFSPSFFIIVYGAAVILCVPSIIIGAASLIYLALYTNINNEKAQG